MPYQNVIELHFTEAEKTQFASLMEQLEALVQPKLRNLSPEENNTVGFINETNKLLVNKVWDYRENQPALSSPDVDWDEFDLDRGDRTFLENGSLRLQGLGKTMTETRRLHDYDNYQNSLLDYKFSQYKDETQPGTGFDTKVEELSQFFPRTGSGGDTDPGIPEDPTV